jgi:DNA ligase 1
MRSITLYIRGNDGNIRQWSCSTQPYGLLIEHGHLNGAVTAQREYIAEGKATRDTDEQIESRWRSRVNKRKDMGYSEDIRVARDKPRNAIGLYKPMLAQKYSQNRVDWANCFVQRKYDGNRCIISRWEDGTMVAYSRNGKLIHTVDHILDSVVLNPGESIDGELYCHGESLQTIRSWVTRQQENSKKLQFIGYDIIAPMSYSERFQLLQSTGVPVAETVECYSHDQMMNLFYTFRGEGYEGAIVRQGDFAYEDGKRSYSLLKVKEFEDAEFRVVDIVSSADGWAVLVCMAQNGSLFNVTAPGTVSQKTDILRSKNMYIGMYVTVEYANLTADGIPFHPVAKIFR